MPRFSEFYQDFQNFARISKNSQLASRETSSLKLFRMLTWKSKRVPMFSNIEQTLLESHLDYQNITQILEFCSLSWFCPDFLNFPKMYQNWSQMLIISNRFSEFHTDILNFTDFLNFAWISRMLLRFSELCPDFYNLLSLFLIFRVSLRFSEFPQIFRIFPVIFRISPDFSDFVQSFRIFNFLKIIRIQDNFF